MSIIERNLCILSFSSCSLSFIKPLYHMVPGTGFAPVLPFENKFLRLTRLLVTPPRLVIYFAGVVKEPTTLFRTCGASPGPSYPGCEIMSNVTRIPSRVFTCGIFLSMSALMRFLMSSAEYSNVLVTEWYMCLSFYVW